MRGELNPLQIVLDGGKCKYCSGNDITDGQWEVNPETKEVFHIRCSEMASTYKAVNKEASEVKIELTGFPKRVPLKEVTPKELQERARQAENARIQGTSKAVLLTPTEVSKQENKLTKVHAIPVRVQRATIKRGVPDMLHEMSGTELAKTIYGNEV